MCRAPFYFSLFGLIISSLGALILLAYEISERRRRFDTAFRKAKLVNRLKSYEGIRDKAIERTKKRNRELYGNENYTGPTKGTEVWESEIAKMKEELNRLDDVNTNALESILPHIHPIAFGLLLFGFWFQLIALLIKGQ